MDKADLGTSQALENHALLVMNALDEAITNLDDPEFLIEMLLTTGKSHQRFENFSMQIFWVRVALLLLWSDLYPCHDDHVRHCCRSALTL